MAKGNIGRIERISGPVVDVIFENVSQVPDIFHALEVPVGEQIEVLECLQQLGNQRTCRRLYAGPYEQRTRKTDRSLRRNCF